MTHVVQTLLALLPALHTLRPPSVDEVKFGVFDVTIFGLVFLEAV